MSNACLTGSASRMNLYNDYCWMGWGMREGKAISTRRDRYDGNGLNGEGFHAWFNADGTLRAGLEFLLEPPRFPAPWSVTGKKERQS